MSFSLNGQSCVPPGFRFHPTEEELLHYYLRKKINFEKMDLEVIPDVDLNKLEPWDIQDKCKIGSTPQNDWYFFSHKDKKYPTGTRTNRATAAGFWKATGRDKPIFMDFNQIGMRKTLVFYIGRAPHGKKSDWIMHEYRLEETVDTNSNSNAICYNEAAQEEGWVVCRVFKKKNTIRNADPFPDTHHNQALDSTQVDMSNQFAPPQSSLCVANHAGGYFDETCCCFSTTSMTQDMHEVDLKGTATRHSESDWTGLERFVTMHLHARVETTQDGALGEGTSIDCDMVNACEAYDEGLHVPMRAHEHASDQKCEVELWNLVR